MTDLGEGRFEVDVILTLAGEGTVPMTFDAGPGTAADGRDAQLVVTDVRSDAG